MKVQFKHMLLLAYLHQHKGSQLVENMFTALQQAIHTVEWDGYSFGYYPESIYDEDVERSRRAIDDARYPTTYEYRTSTRSQQQRASTTIDDIWADMSILRRPLPTFDSEGEFGEGVRPTELEH
jgi:hypothetical protein